MNDYIGYVCSLYHKINMLIKIFYLACVCFCTCAHDACDICKGGKVSKPYMVINMLYIGTASCKSYYNAGTRGSVPKHLCDPLTCYAYTACGCSTVTTKPNHWSVKVSGIELDNRTLS